MKSSEKKGSSSESKGITLIALIVNIIVLLILAGVTLNMVLDKNGLINKAQSAVSAQNVAAIKEALELEKTELYLAKGSLNIDDFIEQITTGNKSFTVDSIDKISDTELEIVINGDNKFIIKDNGKGDLDIEYKGVAQVGDLSLSSTRGNYTYPISGSFTVTTNASGGAISATSSDTNIATVSTNGNTITVTPKNVNGTAKITVKSESTTNYDEKTATYTANVSKDPFGDPINVSNYGKTVTNYSVDGSDKWILYYQNKDHVYLQKAGEVKAPSTELSSSIKDTRVGEICDELFGSFAYWRKSVDHTQLGFRRAAAYLDENNWITLKDTKNGNAIRYVIGATPVTLLIKVLNTIYSEPLDMSKTTCSSNGYDLHITLYSWKTYTSDPSKNYCFPSNYDSVSWASAQDTAYLGVNSTQVFNCHGGGYGDSSGSRAGRSISSDALGSWRENGSKPIVCLYANKYTPTF